MTTTRTSNTKAGDLIADRVAFTGNNLYGVVVPYDGHITNVDNFHKSFVIN
jgi:hypothetical protein